MQALLDRFFKSSKRPDNKELKTAFDAVIKSCGTVPPLTGGAIYNNEFDSLGRKQSEGDDGFKRAQAVVNLYRLSRKDGAAAHLWNDSIEGSAGTYRKPIQLSDQARHNWENSQPGNPFSGMLDARTGLIYLIPATTRAGQKEWDLQLLEKQQFTKDGRHLAKDNEGPISHGKHRNTDHGRAAAYLDGCNYDLKKMMKADAFDMWREQQELSSHWLGFFIHSDEDGNPVMNFNSAQLNAPNLSFQHLTDQELFTKLQEYDNCLVICKKLSKDEELSEKEQSAILTIPGINDIDIDIERKIKASQLTVEEKEAIGDLIQQHKKNLKEMGSFEMCQLPLAMRELITREITVMPRAGMKSKAESAAVDPTAVYKETINHLREPSAALTPDQPVENEELNSDNKQSGP